MFNSEELLIKQGAEAKLYKSKFCNKECIIKERFPKLYRHPILDKYLTQQRLRSESRCIAKCRSLGISTPSLYFVDTNQNRIYMEYISNSITAKHYIDKLNSTYSEMSEIYKSLLMKLSLIIGQLIFKMHSANITHGDLTTSNILIKLDPLNITDSSETMESCSNSDSFMSTSIDTNNTHKKTDEISLVSATDTITTIDMQTNSDTKLSSTHLLTECFSNEQMDMQSEGSIRMLSGINSTNENIHLNEPEIVLIDFGLSNTESTVEDKAVDLYVLERALLSSHPRAFFLFAEILEAYSADYDSTIDVINKFNEVRLRGRKRTMVG